MSEKLEKTSIQAISQARLVIRKEIQKCEAEERGIQNKKHKLELVLKSMDAAENIQRTRRIKHKLICQFCKIEFEAGSTQAKICGKPECKSKQARARSKGTTLLKGDALSEVK